MQLQYRKLWPTCLCYMLEALLKSGQLQAPLWLHGYDADTQQDVIVPLLPPLISCYHSCYCHL